ncbi:hypothetical protein BGW36DRAFT_430319 [Talaromyces proteolyticus]|uniref:Xylanolytic transcriptional activator regulatory domain-containing protein n=1 Tax=Talaromyces proteolyticus TaxID=1131652 RepID=A0AAD4KM50_9EURO|nr:uncharacterized protein BGW36DRAFT_430319 [Talaromyces proteolyticus]KAH8694309.1 hypothetical protein BGW36DRAFT_430319 [Talaromyces proteolyticus]
MVEDNRLPSTFSFSYPDHLISTTNIPFSSYDFVSLDSLNRLPPEDISFLELKGCLHVPNRPILDVLLRRYFLHVHPCLPVLDEAEIWRMYDGNYSQNRSPQKLSLLVLQAIFFASSVFVPLKTLTDMGFRDARSARTALYHRTKLLFNLDAETDILSRGQGAILLTFQTTASDLFSGTHWLSVAIQLAKSAEADISDYELGDKNPETLAKKRLWWCIILRDRIHSLALRRPIQLRPDQAHITCEYLHETDMEDEIEHSKVYSADEKRQLVHIFRLQCQLAVTITDLITIVYSPLWSTHPEYISAKNAINTQNEIDQMKYSLQKWAEVAAKTLETSSTSASAIMFTKLTYMYYDSARLAVYHYEALIWETQYGYHYPSSIQPIKAEIEEVMLNMNQNVEELITQGLACYLPISAIAHAALPLVLSALDSELSSTRLQLVARQRRLHFYKQIMRVLQSRYEAADKVCSFVDDIISYSKLKLDLNSTWMVTGSGVDNKSLHNFNRNSDIASRLRERYQVPGRRMKTICEFFFRQPRSYLRLALLLDHALSRGQYPRQDDIERLWKRLRLSDTPQVSDMPVGTILPDKSSSSLSTNQTESVTTQAPRPMNSVLELERVPQNSDWLSLRPLDIEFSETGCISPSNIMTNDLLQSQTSLDNCTSDFPPIVSNIWDDVHI